MDILACLGNIHYICIYIFITFMGNMDNEKAKSVENIVCEILGSKRELLYIGKGDMPTYMSRYFVEYIFNKYLNISYSCMGKYMNISTRNIMKGVSFVKYGIEHDKYYIDIWNKIKKKLDYD